MGITLRSRGTSQKRRDTQDYTLTPQLEHELRQGAKMKIAIRHTSSIALILFMMPLETSCTFHQQLPSNWSQPALAPAENCPDISGQYVSLGETIKNKTTVPLIFELFVTAKDREQYPLLRWQEVSHVSIQQDKDLLKIAAWKGSEVLYSTSLSKDTNDFICEDGWIKVNTSNAQGYGSSAAEFSSTSRNFVDSDGYLLEKREVKSLIMFSILPVIGSSIDWFRFARHEM